MLIRRSDAARDDREWQTWLDGTDRFGVLAVNNRDATHAPIIVPTHCTRTGPTLLVHLAAINPAWPHLEVASEVRFAVTGDQAYVPSTWRVAPGTPPEHGVPTSYYTSVQFVCRPTIVDDAAELAELLSAQLADHQPEGGHADVTTSAPYGRMLPAIRGLRLDILQVDAKFKYDDEKSPEHRTRVAAHLDARDGTHDRRAARQQRRRLDQDPKHSAPNQP